MNLPDPDSPRPDDSRHGSRPEPADKAPLQFRLRSVLVIVAAIAVLFGLLRGLGVPPHASLIVLVVLALSVAAAVGLVAVIAHSVNGPRD